MLLYASELATTRENIGTGRRSSAPMTTAVVIDRLVHHSAILEFNLPLSDGAGEEEKGGRSMIAEFVAKS